ncbi:16S rRNA (guanine(1207)-N(2))-methyltransferase RsmC [Buchnera aphidicola (Melaphis rhois)]|uniref:16S rRNA (Guanine(1207)-N(2))-methyltransferase RsmC n=1 Tax=Buchnera aphidicola subsp. Melaphis rhois TaxID=118103 RepID=A0A4D6YCG2_BUCMH|nr:16S rRNA (guanine(1207)-N(2))-methyltransferase RsmC [Buchnera aphidicola]QCI23330.1 16S rRNA (guanine(1207)-N(2))-methyltransferase RsmC [Buchnera aphidicola (Melaphis rhois)]
MFKKKIFILGNIYDEFCLDKLNRDTIICTQKFDHWISLKKKTKHKVKFVLLEKKETILNSDVILYFWPNSKIEAIFHLKYIFSILSEKHSIFLIGEKNSGINTAQSLLKKWIQLKKIDSAKHCFLFEGKIILKPKFRFNTFIHNNIWNKININTIPGIFSYNKVDIGSQLLISTFTKSIRGNVLDIGCGSGVLSASLMKYSNYITLTLVDINIAALRSSELTLKANNIIGNIYPSNIYSNINEKFDLIISNPPIHKNFKINLNYIKEIIKNSVKYLTKKGEIRIVINSSISCHKIFKYTFSKYNILNENNNFKVYQAYKRYKN